ncbi:MAG: hypothetical protein ACYDD1_20710 [Caulobacteraceae bacterium]
MSLILYRTHKFDPETRAFCEQLSAESGREVVCLVDETRCEVDVSPFRKLSITPAALRSHKLLVRPDAAWRCGDYGLYLARLAYPAVEHFWLVEYDVRIRTAEPLAQFFDHFSGVGADLIAPFLNERDLTWWWYVAMQRRSEAVYGCLFPLLRVSAGLLDAAFEARRRQTRSPIYRLFWPNDESFLATTAVRQGFSVEDLNERGAFYTDASFSFERPWSGADLARAGADGLIYHPVLYGDDYTRKQHALAKATSLLERCQRKTRAMLSTFT